MSQGAARSSFAGMRKGSIAAVALLACTASAVAEGAQQGSYSGRLYGINDKVLSHPVKGSAVTFSVKNGQLRSFKARGGVSTCVIVSFLPPYIPVVHVYPLTFMFPSTRVKSNEVDGTYRTSGVTNALKGTFTRRTAAGRIDQAGPSSCAAHYRWKATLR